MGMRTAAAPGEEAVSEALESWFHSVPGALANELEQHLLGIVLPDLFGYHIVQLGCHQGDDMLSSTRISHRVRVDLGAREDVAAQLRCAEDALPLASNSVDVLVLPHVLEFADDPRRVLREAGRVLIGEGHIVVSGFNPWSWYGMWSLLWRWQGRAPWHGRFIGVTKLKDWLQLLGFDILSVSRAGFRPPLHGTRVNRATAFLERLGAFCCPPVGNFYVVVGRKRVEGVTPLRVTWRQRRHVLAGGVVEPSARTSNACSPRGD